MPNHHGGERQNAGRPKGSKNKSTIARQAVAEILHFDDAETLTRAIHQRGYRLLLELENIATDPTQPLAARIMSAKTVLPFLLAKPAPTKVDQNFGPDLIELLQQGRDRVRELRKPCTPERARSKSDKA